LGEWALEILGWGVRVVRKGGFKECIQKYGTENFGENHSSKYRKDGILTDARRWMELTENCV
jgi:hypothetical protein